MPTIQDHEGVVVFFTPEQYKAIDRLRLKVVHTRELWSHVPEVLRPIEEDLPPYSGSKVAPFEISEEPTFGP
jgi:hypothetical protein